MLSRNIQRSINVARRSGGGVRSTKSTSSTIPVPPGRLGGKGHEVPTSNIVACGSKYGRSSDIGSGSSTVSSKRATNMELLGMTLGNKNTTKTTDTTKMVNYSGSNSKNTAENIVRKRDVKLAPPSTSSLEFQNDNFNVNGWQSIQHGCNDEQGREQGHKIPNVMKRSEANDEMNDLQLLGLGNSNQLNNHLNYNTSTSKEFYTTMQNVLLRTNIHSSTSDLLYNHILSSISTAIINDNNGNKNSYQQQKTMYSPPAFHSNDSGRNDAMMIKYRQFSSTAGTQPPKSGDNEHKSKSASPTSTPPPTENSSSPPPPKALKKDASMQERAMAMIKSVASSIASFLVKIPGVMWFYLTHPKEFREKLVELKEAAKKEAHHYYMGSKLLIADLKTARQMLGKLLQGSPLTRRERKQFIRTVTDVFRLVPMSIFVLIPFMEFALPFALKLFPNMLPSTFQDSLKAEENMKRELKSRIAMAEFFQETLQDLAKGQRKMAAKKKEKIKADDGPTTELESTESREETATSFLEFIEKARKGEFLPPEVIIRYSSFFKDELTLDNMPRMQLINMCKYMNIPPYGNENFLRFQLRHKIRVLQEDDQRILWEGIDSLTKMELREACQERGMRSTGMSKEAYKRSLQQWIDLSVNRNVPISLLIMSRTFFLREEMASRASVDTDGSKSVAGLADAISGLDKEVVNEVILESVTPEDKKSDPELLKLKLEVLEHQNELIQEEKKQREAEEAKKAEQALEKQEAEKEAAKIEEVTDEEKEANEEGSELQVDKSVTVEEADKIVATDSASTDAQAEPKTLDVERETQTPEEELEEKEEDKTLSAEEIDAISELVSPDPVSAERQKLELLKAAMQQEDESEDEGPKATSADDVPSAQSDDEFGNQVPTETFADEQDSKAASQIATEEEKSRIEADSSTTISMEGVIQEDSTGGTVPTEEEEEEDEFQNEKLDKTISRLKSKVESMVGNIETQLSDVEEKIGNKLHILDKDMDGILTREEMSVCLQTVLKRPLSTHEAMAIAADMDKNQDGLFTLDELSKWLETSKIVKLVEEGRDAEVDEIIALQAKNLNDEQKE